MLESKHLRTLEEKFLGHNDNGVFFSFVAFLAYYREPWIFGKSFFDTLPSSSIFINILSCHDKVLFFSFFVHYILFGYTFVLVAKKVCNISFLHICFFFRALSSPLSTIFCVLEYGSTYGAVFPFILLRNTKSRNIVQGVPTCLESPKINIL